MSTKLKIFTTITLVIAAFSFGGEPAPLLIAIFAWIMYFLFVPLQNALRKAVSKKVRIWTNISIVWFIVLVPVLLASCRPVFGCPDGMFVLLIPLAVGWGTYFIWKKK